MRRGFRDDRRWQGEPDHLGDEGLMEHRWHKKRAACRELFRQAALVGFLGW